MLELAVKGNKWYWGWMVVLLGVIGAGFGLYLMQLKFGLGITGMSRDVSWGFYIANFTYLVGVAGISVALGLGLDWVVALFDIDILAGMANSGAQERELPVMLSMLCLLLLAVAAIRPFRRYLIQGKAGKNGSCCD